MSTSARLTQGVSGEDVPAAALGWAPGVGAHVVGSQEVALLRDHGAVALRGRIYTEVAPLIDGRLTADEIVQALEAPVDAALAYYALSRLQKLGYVVAGDGASEVSDDLAVVVAEFTGDVSAALTDDYLRPEVDAVVRQLLAAGRRVLPARPVGERLWVGPLLGPDELAVWTLLLRRLRLNRPSDVAALAAGAVFPLFPVNCSDEAIDAGVSVLEPLRGAYDLRRAVVIVERDGTEAVRHPISHVAPLAAQPLPPFGTSLPTFALQPAPKAFWADGGHRTVPPEETLRRVAPIVSAFTGVVSEPVLLDPGALTPVYSALVASRHTRSRRRLTASMGAAGKGMTEAQARAGCVAEGIERYSCAFFGAEPRRRARLETLGDLAIDPRTLVHFSEAQFTARNAGQTPSEGFNVVQPPFDPSEPIEWTPVRSLVDGATRWVPSAHIFFGYEDPEASGEPFARADSNGCAAGNTFEEAALQGLLELIERDATAMWWYSRAPRPEIDLLSFDNPAFDRIIQAYAERGEELHVLDLTVDTGVAAVAAVCWRGDGTRICLGLGAHLDPRIAVSRALSEIAQSAPVANDPDPGGEYGEWLTAATTVTEPYVVPAGPTRTADDLPRFESPDLREELEWCVAQLARLGHDVLFYDHSQPDIDFPVVRIMAPGLRHFWRRLAPGRLYDVPVALGWVAERLTEEELNPIGFFL